MARKFALLGTFFAGIAIALGAFGAHALKSILPEDSLAIFETGVRYQFMHSNAFILLSLYLSKNSNSHSFHKVGYLFGAGIILFSGSLYVLSFQPLCSFSYKMIVGPLTPIGGICWMLGWGIWGYQIYKSK